VDITDFTLPLRDLDQGNYVDLLELDDYFTIANPRRFRRHRIRDNLLGDRRFCPVVRRTDILREFEAKDLCGRCRHLLSRYEPALLRRALEYLYTKETKSSFEIERERPGSSRITRFVALLKAAEGQNLVAKTA